VHDSPVSFVQGKDLDPPGKWPDLLYQAAIESVIYFRMLGEKTLKLGLWNNIYLRRLQAYGRGHIRAVIHDLELTEIIAGATDVQKHLLILFIAYAKLDRTVYQDIERATRISFLDHYRILGIAPDPTAGIVLRW
jgi:hypothetical protein